MAKPELVEISRLVEDTSFYPRVTVSAYHVREMVEALQAGATLPPIIAQRGTGIIVDGVHRHRAYLAIGQPEVSVEWRDYPDSAAIWMDAVTLNAAHGMRLSRFDQARIAIRSAELSITPESIARLLAVPLERFTRRAEQKNALSPAGATVQVKSTLRHLGGTTLTDRAMAANARAGGMSIAFYLDQIINLLEAGEEVVDLASDAYRPRLERIVSLGCEQLGWTLLT